MTDPFLDHPVLSARYFYPWPNHFDDPFYVDGTDYRLGCRYRKISDDYPTIIHFHGNGETVADYLGDFEERIAEMGANLFLAEFRGYGMSSGEPGLVAMLADVKLIVEASGVPPDQIILFGRSLGSLYAVHGASLYPYAAGLIVESGLADPLERILVRVEPYQLGATMESLRTAVDTHLNQKQKIQSFRGRTLIMHTWNDDLVNVSHAERLYEWANEPKEQLIFDRGDHNSIMVANTDSYFKAVEKFIKELY
ncbi:alpha/beta hydrolase [Geobacter pelophilus]|uniref:Alpha/beta hydrolase n=1 Tax=Geoanaerobacter pelophilus TaxID=60036 RepID=A0AAW4L4J3_9BACT|nr:alpha/beta hydrolase [Geoanaerobacter pelophilus]MBT0666124.1 alpha/beta hydrolase [Geoanaerobacter pelophilus]